MDDTHALSLIRQSVQDGGSVHVNWALPAPAIELVVITPLHG